MTDTLESVAESNPATDEGIEEGPETWLNASELAAHGAWRETPEHKLYWLKTEHLVEYERMNAQIDTDADFWAWFTSFVDTVKLKPTVREERKERKERGSVSSAVKSEHWGWGWKGKKQDSGDYLRSMWSGWGYDSASSDLTRRLTIALGAINTTVQAIRTKSGRYLVRLASDDTINAPTSYTSFDEDLVVVSPQPLKDPKLEEQRGIEITTGWALHEASHTEYTEDVYKEILKPYVLRPAAVAGMLCNILEDVRIERLTGDKFPGFEPYFRWSLEYLWQITGKDADGVSIPRDGRFNGQSLNDKLNWIIRTIRWPVEFEPIVRAVGVQDDVDEFTWWREWLAEYDSGKIGMRQSIIEALARLAADPETEKQMKEQTQNEEAMERLGERLSSMSGKAAKDLIRRMIEKLGEKGSIVAPCPSPSQGVGDGSPTQGKDRALTHNEAQEIEKLIAEEMSIDIPPPRYKDAWNGTAPKTIVTKPLETPDSKSMYRTVRDPLLARLRGAFVFRPVAPEYSNRLLRSGAIDDDELWRARTGDYRVFEQRVIEAKPDTDITLLIDMSGSMAGRKLDLAVRLVTLIRMILATTHGVTFRVRAHTNGWLPPEATQMLRIWEAGDPDTRLGIPQVLPHGGNNDGWALGWCIDELLAIGRPGNQKILFIFSDGIPAGMGYTGDPAMKHVRAVTEWGEKHGVTTIQVALGVFSETDQAKMYKHYVVYKDDASLPGQLTKILSKLL